MNNKEKIDEIPEGFTAVRTLEDLNNIRNNLNGKYWLSNNLDFTGSEYQDGKGWTPIGDWNSIFTGIFYGNGHTISNLFINRPSTDYQGLFGYIDVSSEIKNLGVVGVNVTGEYNVGGLVGANDGSVSNSYSTGSVSGNNNVGCLAGCNDGNVSKSYASGSVSGNENVGGLVGFNDWTVTTSK